MNLVLRRKLANCLEKQIFYFSMLSFKLLNKVNLLYKLYLFVNRIDTISLAIAN